MNLFKIFDATRKQREQIKAWAAKAGMDGEAIISKVESAFETDAEQFAAARWLIKGYEPKSFKQALYICAQKHIDPMGVNPEELVQKNPDVKPKERPINPDDVLTDRKDEGDGIVTYAARDEDREVLRQIINTHYGKDASPWCLLAGDGNGNLTSDSEGYWNDYNAYPKRVAFRNGKLLAFSAGSKKSVREWWDRMDRSFPFIPYDGKRWLGRNGGTYEIRKGEVFKTEGDTYSRLSNEYSTNIEKSGVSASVSGGSIIKIDGHKYEISSQDATHYYVDNANVKFGVLKDTLQLDGLLERFYYGTLVERCTYENGVKTGSYESYHYENGQLRVRCTYKHGELDGPYERYYENGQLRVRCTYKHGELDGPYEGYYSNGQLSSRCSFKNGHIQGSCERYFGNGQLMSRGTYENGELIGPFERYDLQGHLVESDG